MISTHAPLAGRDVYCVAAVGCGPIFQPTRPLRGATLSLRALPLMSSIFQPTRPLRGATSIVKFNNRFHVNFNPRAPCGARHQQHETYTETCQFQPTRPLRGATGLAGIYYRYGKISTHAPLAGRDPRPMMTIKIIKNFNPRAPCGARLAGFMHRLSAFDISTHAPLAGRDELP